MSYPEPTILDSKESLYKQAKFFYDQYEKKKKELEECIRSHQDAWVESRGPRCEGCKYLKGQDCCRENNPCPRRPICECGHTRESHLKDGENPRGICFTEGCKCVAYRPRIISRNIRKIGGKR